MLRSGMMGWLTIMQDTTTWTPQQHKAAGEEFQLYKSQLRPLIRDALLYHVSPRPDGVHWDAVEYFDPQRQRGVVYVFRGSTAAADHRIVLHGLRARVNYHLRFHDHSSSNLTISGRELMSTGLLLHLRASNSSELVFFSSQYE
jgi:hypothetical protein